VGDGEPQVKGLSLRHWLEAFSQLYGRERVEGLKQRLDPAVAGRLGAIDAGAWYPVSWYRAMCAAARAETGGGLEAIGRIARASASAEFSGIHRVLLLFVSPQRLLTASARVFERYYTHGSVEATSRGRRSATVRWLGCHGFDENLWHDTFHASAVVIEMCGGKHVTFAVQHGGGDGDTHAQVVFDWR
jgi:hypothetical protein